MGNDPIKRLITQYLIKVKEIISTNGFTLIERDKTMKSITSLGITISDVKDILLSLTPQHYFDGPLKDDDTQFKESIFVYKINYADTTIYIKLKIVMENDKEIVRIISFHKDENENKR